jgi:hypothetical protein
MSLVFDVGKAVAGDVVQGFPIVSAYSKAVFCGR